MGVRVGQKLEPEESREELGAGQIQHNSLGTRVCSSWEELKRLATAWDRILQTTASLTAFSTPEWLGAWWKGFGHGKQLVALVISDASSKVVGLAPLYEDPLQGPLGWRLRRLRLVGDGSEDSDNLDLIFRSGYEEACAQTLLDWLAQQSGWDLCELNTLPANSVAADRLLRHLKARGWVHTIRQRSCSVVVLPDSWEAYLNQISKKERTKINYYMGRLQKRYQVCFHKCTENAELATCLESFFELHQKRWRLRGEQGSFSSTSRREFYSEMARSFLARQWLEFWLLKLDGRIAAAQFGFRYGDAVFSLQEGFDPLYSSDRVGYLLRSYVLKQLIAAGVRRYDFLGGKDDSKERWGAQLTSYLDVDFAKPSSRGSLYIRLKHDANVTKEWLRAHLPSSAFSLLRRTYRRLHATQVGL